MSHHPGGLAKAARRSGSMVLERERLFARLDAGVERSVTWITGPPGSGKTTLVSSYVDARGRDYLWYQIDPGDADVATFFYYMGLAVRRQAGRKEDRLPKFSPAYLADVPTFARRYFREIYARLGSPFAVVFDNYQDLARQSVLHEVISVGLAEIPEGGSVIFTSRKDPPAAMARLRANQAIEIVGWEELKLTPDELEAMVEARGQKMSAESLSLLHEKTQGWAAGVVLMLEHARAGGRLGGSPSAFVPQVIFDYFAGEIFERFDDEDRQFLLESAFLPQMTPAMVRKMTRVDDAAERLRRLAGNDYFVSRKPVDDGEKYQFHPLLREFLLARAADSYGESRLSDLRRKAAVLLEDAGHVDGAVELLIENADWERVAELTIRHGAGLMEHGRGETLVEWLEAVPSTVLDAHPWTLYWSGAARFHSSPRESRRYYDRAFAAFGSGDRENPKGLILSCCGIIDTILYELDDLSLLDRWIDALDALLEANPETLYEGIEARVTCSMFMSLVLRQPDRPDVVHWVERAHALSRASGDGATRTSVEPLVALSIMWAGHFPKARAVLDDLDDLIASAETSPLALVTQKVIESMYQMLLGDADACMKTVDEGLRLSTSNGIRVWGNQLLVNGIGGVLGVGNLALAEQLLHELETSREATRRVDRCLFHYYSAWYGILEQDQLGAYQHYKKALNLALEVGIPFFQILCRLGLAQALFACGDDRKGQSQLRQVHEQARNINNRLLEFMTLLVYAHIAISAGKRRSGLNSLRYALTLGREHGYTHVLGWQPDMMAKLCVLALEEEIEVDYVRDLIRKRDLFPDTPPYGVRSWPWRVKISTLGSFLLVTNDCVQSFPGKAPLKPLELLKILIAFGARGVRVEQLAETLRPHIDGDHARRSFATTLHRLRKLLGADETVLLHDGRVSLDERHVRVDVWVLERSFMDADSALRHASAGADPTVLDPIANDILAVYRGPFLAGESEHPCYISCREHLRSKFLRYVAKLGNQFERTDGGEKAVEYYERAIEVDRLSEGLYRHLMTCYAKRGRRAEALEVYERFRATLSATLQVAPSREFTEMYEQMATASSKDLGA